MDLTDENNIIRNESEMLDGITIHEGLNNGTNGSTKKDISENHTAQIVQRVSKNEVASNG